MSGLLDLVQFNLVTLGVALLIGVAAGRWMFAQPPAPEATPEDRPKP